jgi:hypothetical protein
MEDVNDDDDDDENDDVVFERGSSRPLTANSRWTMLIGRMSIPNSTYRSSRCGFSLLHPPCQRPLRFTITIVFVFGIPSYRTAPNPKREGASRRSRRFRCRSGGLSCPGSPLCLSSDRDMPRGGLWMALWVRNSLGHSRALLCATIFSYVIVLVLVVVCVAGVEGGEPMLMLRRASSKMPCDGPYHDHDVHVDAPVVTPRWG